MGFSIPEWLTRRNAEPYLHWLKLPLEALVLFLALLPSHFLYVLALTVGPGELLGELLWRMDWRPMSLMMEFVFAASITSITLLVMEPKSSESKRFWRTVAPIRTKTFSVICKQIIYAAGLATAPLLIGAWWLLPDAGRLGPHWIFSLVFLYVGCQVVGTLSLWSLRRLAWKDGQQVQEWWEREIDRRVDEEVSREEERHRRIEEGLRRSIQELEEHLQEVLVDLKESRRTNTGLTRSLTSMTETLQENSRSHQGAEAGWLGAMERMNRSLRRAEKELEESRAQIVLLGRRKSSKSRGRKRLGIKQLGYVSVLDPDAVQWIDRQGGTPTVHLKDATLSCAGPIKQIAKDTRSLGFVQISESALINPRYLARLRRGEHHEAVMSSGKRLHIPRKRWPKVLKDLALITI